MRKSGFSVASVLAVAFAAGCGGGQASDGVGAGVSVVASTTQVGDFVRNVGGDAIEEHQILQPNSDPHDYEPRPEDVRETGAADLVFMSGDDLDPWVGDVVSESGSDANVVNLAQNLPDTDKLRGEEDSEYAEYDPHWWHDPTNAEAAVGEIRDSLIAADPENEQVYRDNAEAYLGRIQTLDSDMEACIAKVPEDERKLVTDHDAFGYFTNRYDIEVVGAVIPSQTTQSQPSAGETADLISLIERENVRAVFPESSINAGLAETIADETGATSEYTLYGDTLGPEGSEGDTYLKMEAANAGAMVQGFTGGEVSCDISAENS